jgi:hypothetical protein
MPCQPAYPLPRDLLEDTKRALQAFRQGLRELGDVEGQAIRLEEVIR